MYQHYLGVDLHSKRTYQVLSVTGDAWHRPLFSGVYSIPARENPDFEVGDESARLFVHGGQVVLSYHLRSQGN